MSEDRRQVIEQKIPGEVWWIITVLSLVLPMHWHTEGGDEWEADQMPKPGGDPWNEAMDFSLWHISVRGDKTSATIRITAPPEQAEEWQDLLRRVRDAAHKAQRLHRMEGGAQADYVIEQYYRSKAHGGRKTLKDFADEANLSHDYLRKRKVDYDRLGMWGRKKGGVSKRKKQQ